MNILTPFQQKALAYNKHISLTANAGSGKTTVLAKRYVEILEKENIPIGSIIAITFTEKAASELYSKIVAELERKIIDSSNNKVKFENIRRSIVSAKISTIHSFCIDILKDYAPEAGIDANFLPIDSRTSEELLDQSIEESISSALDKDLNDIKYLIRLFGNRSQLSKNTKSLFSKRKTVESLIEKIYNRDISDIAGWFNEKFEIYLNQYFSEIIEQLINGIKDINSLVDIEKQSDLKEEVERLLLRLSEKENLTNKLSKLNEIKKIILTGKGTVRIKGYLSKKTYKENENIIDKIESIFNEMKLLENENERGESYELARFGKIMINFYNNVNERYVLKKQQRSFLDFEDLLIYTQKLTLDNEIRKELSAKYKYIMIDEYQDTNEIQYKIFMPILNNLNTGNLFIVGDEKQSIYRFREAEVELFDRTRNDIKSNDNSEGVLELPHSFRLAPNLALFTNILFEKLFNSNNENYREVNYSNLICAYTGDKPGMAEFLISDGEVNREADLTAKKILDIISDAENGYDFKDFTILCTKRKYFSELEEALSKNDIPFNIVGGRGFFQQQLVLDIYSYLSFLVNRNNDLALASILRGPFYGLSDIEISKLCLADGDSLYEKLNKSEKSKRLCDQLNKHLEISKSLKTNELIRQICNDTGFWTYISSKSNGPQEIANLKKLIQKSIDEESKGFSSLYDFTQFLYRAIYNIEDEGQADIDIFTNAVNIMTVHQSKGLEFKIVILYKTNHKSFDEKLKSKEVIIDKEFGLLSKLPHENNFFENYTQAPIIGIFNYLQKKKSQEEIKRLLYVAITRAEERLIISAELSNKIWEGSFADLIFKSFEFSPDQENIKIAGELEFMKFDGDRYKLQKKSLNTDIAIYRDVEPAYEYSPKKITPANDNYDVFLEPKKFTEKNEIISASKISLFLNCPKKYELTYEFGYGELIKIFRTEKDIELNHKEDADSVSSSILGMVLHAFLAKDIPLTELKYEFDNIINAEEINYIVDEREKEIILNESSEILEKFYLSDHYLKLKNYSHFLNEIEFYKRENDYFLYGIIDKLIVTENEIIIVDYKSDAVNDNNKSDKIETYMNQLMFYAYIISYKYPDIKTFELMIIFLRDDRFSFSKQVSKNAIMDFGKIIGESVHKIRNKEFSERKKGCKDMQYYLLPGK